MKQIILLSTLAALAIAQPSMPVSTVQGNTFDLFINISPGVTSLSSAYYHIGNCLIQVTYSIVHVYEATNGYSSSQQGNMTASGSIGSNQCQVALASSYLLTNGYNLHVTVFGSPAAPVPITTDYAWSYAPSSLYSSTIGEWVVQQNSNPPVINSPAPGSLLLGSSVTFSWTAGPSPANGYWLFVGTSPYMANVYASSVIHNQTQVAAPLPTNGTTLYVQLWWWDPAIQNWKANNYTYTAYTALAPPQNISPAAGSILPSSGATISWSPNPVTPASWAQCGTSGDSGNLSQYDQPSTFVNIPRVPEQLSNGMGQQPGRVSNRINSQRYASSSGRSHHLTAIFDANLGVGELRLDSGRWRRQL